MINYIYLILFVLPAIFTGIFTPYFIKFVRKKGITRPDAHKPGNPQVAYLGGVPLFLGATVGMLVAAVFSSEYWIELLVHYITILIVFVIGLIDDLKVLKGEIKTILTVLAILPTGVGALLFRDKIVLGRPWVPIIGRLRLTIAYWLLLPFAIAGPANVVNMLDIFNGVMPSTTLLIFTTLLVSSIIRGSETGIILALIWMGVLVGYIYYNMYPAQIFNGDSGSLMVGTAIGSIALLTHMEFIVLVALFPHLLNGMLILASFRGFKEHREVKERPITVLGDGRLKANLSPSAPTSLTRLILLIGGDMREYEIVLAYILIEFVASLLAIITGGLS